MSKYVLDASALLALFNMEQGEDIVAKLLPLSVMSTVNIAEVISELDKKLDIKPEEGKKLIMNAIDKIVPLDLDQAVAIGNLRKYTSHLGLSLGDRACLALGITTGYPIYTADRAWGKLELDCKIILIR
ncbi:MAG: PIN domain-containing protein [Rickettsiaceae bacterium]|nr:MAG: PIN domain-containing protein [Rickettsiaceae bacterium]